MVNKQFSQPNILLEYTIFLLGAKTFRFSCERGHKRTVFAYNSSLGWKRSTHRKQRDFSKPKNRCYTISAQMANETNLKKKIDIQKHHLPSYSVFPGFIKSISIPRFGFTVCPEFRLCFGNQSSANMKWSFVALRPPILLFLLLTNFFGYIVLLWALQRFTPKLRGGKYVLENVLPMRLWRQFLLSLSREVRSHVSYVSCRQRAPMGK